MSSLLLLNALGYGLGIVGGVFSIWQFIESRKNPQARKTAFISAIAATAILLVTFFAANTQPATTQLGNPPIGNPNPSQATQSGAPVSLPNPTQTSSVPTAIPSPTPIAKSEPGTVLCQADTSQGWNGWNGTSDWKVFNGTLLNDGTKWMSQLSLRHPTIVAPCDLSASPDYAVEVTMQMTTPPNGDACFGIYVRGNSTGSTWQGYAAVVNQACVSGALNTVRISVDDDQKSQWLTTAPFSPRTNTHTYRVEVKGTTIKFIIDGGLILQANDNRYLSGGQVGFWDSQIQLNISSFKIIAL